MVSPLLIGDPVVAYEVGGMSKGNNYSWSFLDDFTGNVSEYNGVRSPLKFCVLDLADRRQGLTYLQLADETGMPETYAADRLTKYARKGLLQREREGEAGISIFTLSRRGHRRLLWFRRR